MALIISKGLPMVRIFPFLLTALLLWGCAKENPHAEAIDKIPMEVTVDRFDLKFYDTQRPLRQLKQQYPYFFPVQYTDAFWQERRVDTLQQEIMEQVRLVFPNMDKETEDIALLFKHLTYYFPDFEQPKVLTVVSDVGYENKVIYADSLMLVSIDTYLGKDNLLYVGIPEYKRKNMDRSQITSDMVVSYVIPLIPPPKERTLLAQMIYSGKILYLKDVLLPFCEEHQRIGYTAQELQWAKENEDPIWRYLVERDLLFDADPKLYQRFIADAPFTKFYLEIDNESPGRLGQWLGWQIVRSCMDNNSVPLQELLSTPAQELFNKARYKPKR